MANERMLEELWNQERDSNYEKRYRELNDRQKVLQAQIAEQQELLHAQEKELNDSRKRLKEEQLMHEKNLMLESRERESFYEERERELLARRLHFEKFLNEQKAEWNAFMEKKQHEIAEKEKKLESAYVELEQERERYTKENIKQIESKSENYVNTALTGLESKENSFHFLAKMWSGLGAVSIVLGVLFVIISTFYGANTYHDAQGFTWTYFLYVTFRGLIVVAMFIALARYAFIFSNSYMHESLKNSERRHAINFGKFYLEAYGANASWEQVKEAFQHWNINSDSAFTKKNASDFDPKVMENVIELSKVLSRNTPDKKVESIAQPKV
ncbi:hypothetical protein [Shewanella xiamenensis]|uniref:hypothetical protein n=1 Tax=Shewanella xiamenensis TaxID=332186 RepID=UPI000C129E3C|nr:hypothetical protein [Shewanella xiamenensis]PHY62900.1 hypothetical protein CS023_13665 [Shewanella xiamenensis]